DGPDGLNRAPVVEPAIGIEQPALHGLSIQLERHVPPELQVTARLDQREVHAGVRRIAHDLLDAGNGVVSARPCPARLLVKYPLANRAGGRVEPARRKVIEAIRLVSIDRVRADHEHALARQTAGKATAASTRR